MTRVLKPGDDHNLLRHRHDGDPHSQYYHKNAPFSVTTGPTTLAGPVNLEELVTITVDDTTPLHEAVKLSNSSIVVYVGTGAPGQAIVLNEMSIQPTVDPITFRGQWVCGDGVNYIWKKMATDEMMARVLNLETTTITMAGGTYHNYNYTAAAGALFWLYRWNLTGNATITGFTAPSIVGNRTPFFDIVNVSNSFTLTLVKTSGSSDPNNQIITGDPNASIPIGPNDSCRMWYDGITLKWRVLK